MLNICHLEDSANKRIFSKFLLFMKGFSSSFLESPPMLGLNNFLVRMKYVYIHENKKTHNLF